MQPYQVKMIIMLESVFPVLKDNISINEDNNITFSVLIENEDEIYKMYEKLSSLKEHIATMGFNVFSQDDNEYFGAELFR